MTDGSDITQKLIRRNAAMAYNEAFDVIEEGKDPLKALELSAASLYLWRQVGNERNFAIGLWQLSRALVLAGSSELAVKAAEESLELLRQIEVPADFLVASIHEGWARALIANNDPRAAEAVREAAELIDAISDPKEREIIFSQFEDISDYKS